VVGGLNASGCIGSGNFFCFSGYAAAAETMSFTFALTAGQGAFESWNPALKIDWVAGGTTTTSSVCRCLEARCPNPARSR